jgi:hypothetical protein
LVRLGVTTTPEQAASASASSRTIGPAFSLICMAWGVQQDVPIIAHDFGLGNGAAGDAEHAGARQAPAQAELLATARPASL